MRWPIFILGRKKLLLAFEYGVVMAETARQQGVELTPELIEKAERMLEGEFPSTSASRLATNIVPNILTAFELDITK